MCIYGLTGVLSSCTTQGVDGWKLIQNVLVINNISVYVFREITTKSVYVLLGIFMTYPFLAPERGGGVSWMA